MPKFRNALPQMHGSTFLSDGGMETTLIFLEGAQLPLFASFVLLDDTHGRAQLNRYYESYLAIARRHRVGFVLDSSTWRANADWGAKLGYDARRLRSINQTSIKLLEQLREEWEAPETPCVLSGAIGPRGDGYKAGRMDAGEAEAYHAAQIAAFADSEADMVAAYTMNTIEEAVASRGPRALSTCLARSPSPSRPMARSRQETRCARRWRRSTAETGGSPLYYMINCAHPTHFAPALEAGEPWTGRIRGIRANASARATQELDESALLDAGDPLDLGSATAC